MDNKQAFMTQQNHSNKSPNSKLPFRTQLLRSSQHFNVSKDAGLLRIIKTVDQGYFDLVGNGNRLELPMCHE